MIFTVTPGESDCTRGFFCQQLNVVMRCTKPTLSSVADLL